MEPLQSSWTAGTKEIDSELQRVVCIPESFPEDFLEFTREATQVTCTPEPSQKVETKVHVLVLQNGMIEAAGIPLSGDHVSQLHLHLLHIPTNECFGSGS